MLVIWARILPPMALGNSNRLACASSMLNGCKGDVNLPSSFKVCFFCSPGEFAAILFNLGVTTDTNSAIGIGSFGFFEGAALFFAAIYRADSRNELPLKDGIFGSYSTFML